MPDPPQQALKPGQDVSGLMSGTDVTALMDQDAQAQAAQATAGAAHVPKAGEPKDAFQTAHPIIGTIERGVRAVPGGAAIEDFFTKHPSVPGATAGGVVGGALGLLGGPAAPITVPLGAALGTGAGSFGTAVAGGVPTGAAATGAAEDAAVQGALGAVGKIAGPMMESAATRLMAGKLKPVINLIRQTPETTGGEGLTAGQEALARGAVKAPGLTLGAKSEATRASLNDLVAQVDAAIADADAHGTKVLTAGLRDTLLQTIRDKVAPGQGQFSPAELLEAARPIDQILERQPQWLTVAQAQDLKQTILKGIKFGPGTNGTFDTVARKAVGQGARQSIELADTVNRAGRGLMGSPIADLNAEMAGKIPLQQVLDRGTLNAGRRDALSGVGEYLAAASGSPAPLALSALHRASSPIATVLDRMAPTDPMRTALLAILAKAGLSTALGTGR